MIGISAIGGLFVIFEEVVEEVVVSRDLCHLDGVTGVTLVD